MIKYLKYDFLFLKRTSKLIVFPVLVLMFSIISPLTAKYMNELLETLLIDSGVDFVFPDPVITDSYIQYISDLNEIILFVVLFVAVSIFIRDKTKGLLPLIVSKPVSRTKYLLSKQITFASLLFVSLMIGYGVFTYYTYVLFGGTYFIEGFLAIILYFVYLLFLMSIAMLMSVLFKSYIIAIIMTFLGYILFTVIGAFQQVTLLMYSPNVLNSHAVKYISTQSLPDGVLMTVIVTLLLTTGITYLSIYLFKKQEIPT
ncbi:MAG: hypothetical protein K9L26_01010 [Candidatus Izimaplasma sp.]|nr:hypothetical protein [Candidatus Izimaplasma bacterium]